MGFLERSNPQGMMHKEKFIALERAIFLAKEVSVGIDDERQKMFLEILASSCPEFSTEFGPAIYARDFVNFIKNFQDAYKENDSSYFMRPRGLCVERVVGIGEFCTSEEFLGLRGSVRPVVEKGLKELFESPRSSGYVECVLCGGVGWGKTFFSYLAVGYMLYRLSCFHSPQLEYGMAPGTSIVFIQQSKKYELAKKVVFDQFAEILRNSPYFTKVFPFDTSVKSELRFPKNIQVLPIGGSDTSALGMNVFGGVIDEMNFMARVRNSERIVAVSGMDEEYDQAERVYTTLIRRMKARYIQKGGKLPGKLLLISSANYPGDFTDRKLEEAKRDRTILAIHHNQWEAVPDFYGEARFLVEIGNPQRKSKILSSIEEASDPDLVIQVPSELRSDFERDIDAALRDFGGYVVGVENPFISDIEGIEKAQVDHVKLSNGRSLFRYESVVIDEVLDPDSPQWENLIDMGYLKECILSPNQAFALHIDVASSEDALGLAIGRLFGYKLIPTARVLDPKTSILAEVRDIRLPMYMIDGVLRMVPSKHRREINLDLVRDLVGWLRGELFIKWATLDSYQSPMFVMAFRKMKIRSGVLSVDENLIPYTEVKMALRDRRITFPRHGVLVRELRELKRVKNKEKIDHPANGSKDCSDAVAGVVHMLRTKEADLITSSSHRRGRAIPTDSIEIESSDVETSLPVMIRGVGGRNLGIRHVRIRPKR